MARTRNPAISPVLLVGLGVGAYLLLRGASTAQGGGGDLKGSFNARTFGGIGELFADGRKIGDVSPTRATFTLPAGVPIVLQVKFADGTVSPERRIVLQASGPASEGGFNPQQLFVTGSNSVAAASYRAQIDALNAAGQAERATAVQMLADAQALVRSRQYDQALGAYAALAQTYPGTPEARAAEIAKALLTAQLQTTAGRAALDRANPI